MIEWQCARCQKWFLSKDENPVYCSGACGIAAQTEVAPHERVPKMRVIEDDEPYHWDGTKYDLWVNRRWVTVHTMEYQCVRCAKWHTDKGPWCGATCYDMGHRDLQFGRKLRAVGYPTAAKHKHKDPLKPKPEGV